MNKEVKAIAGEFVSNRINMLAIDKSDSKGEKAIWRHAFAKKACEDMKAWSLLQRDIPDELAGSAGKPSYVENAAYMAIAAYAACGSNASKVTLGQAAAGLGDNARERFTRLEKARTLDELWIGLKGLLRLISSNKGTGIDYAGLAQELIDWQFDSIQAVRKWERDYYWKTAKKQ